ncbi:hypothetical protein ABVK25_001769 [Lepraria finkii]|uniref:Uncharacterized protein n=1 Tax=Lepraria finkii TaxID=1340010 RepID=A0ABR4BK07_9LECA
MFQRLKGAIDSKIAEEQARQRLSQRPPSRSNSSAKRPSSRAISPTKRAQGSRGRQDGDPPAKGPDPADFEPEFVIDDDEASRTGTPRSGTPRPAGDRNGTTAVGKSTQEDATLETGEAAADEPRSSSDLPTDVRVKLRKLEKLESRYHELLRSYRVAHARVLSIEPFETSLRENTPLTSISDPKALVEYLNQINLKGDMILDELKRVSNDRDTYKQKLSQEEKSVKEAWDEVANLRSLKKTKDKAEESERTARGSHSDDENTGQDLVDGDPLGETAKSPPSSVKSPTISVRGMSLFSPKPKATESRQGSEDLFSYDSEIPRLETGLQEQQH